LAVISPKPPRRKNHVRRRDIGTYIGTTPPAHINRLRTPGLCKRAVNTSSHTAPESPQRAGYHPVRPRSLFFRITAVERNGRWLRKRTQRKQRQQKSERCSSLRSLIHRPRMKSPRMPTAEKFPVMAQTEMSLKSSNLFFTISPVRGRVECH
jgi:hypothetical protein